jgi:hypothetical protein
MTPFPKDEIGRRLGFLAARPISILPRALRLTPRRRRFLHLVLCAPGAGAVIALPLHKTFALLAAGALWVVAASALRALGEPHLLGEGRHDQG